MTLVLRGTAIPPDAWGDSTLEVDSLFEVRDSDRVLCLSNGPTSGVALTLGTSLRVTPSAGFTNFGGTKEDCEAGPPSFNEGGSSAFKSLACNANNNISSVRKILVSNMLCEHSEICNNSRGSDAGV